MLKTPTECHILFSSVLVRRNSQCCEVKLHPHECDLIQGISLKFCFRVIDWSSSDIVFCILWPSKYLNNKHSTVWWICFLFCWWPVVLLFSVSLLQCILVWNRKVSETTILETLVQFCCTSLYLFFLQSDVLLVVSCFWIACLIQMKIVFFLFSVCFPSFLNNAVIAIILQFHEFFLYLFVCSSGFFKKNEDERNNSFYAI